MKKLLFLAITLLFAGSVSAQYYHPRPRWIPGHRQHKKTYDSNFRPTFTLIGGMNIANTVNAYNQDYQTDTKIGWHVGVGFDLPITYPLSLSPEVLFSQKGYTAATSYGEFKQTTNYIDVPLLLKFHVVPGFNLLVGPQISFLLGTHNSYSDGFNTTYESTYNNSYDGYNKTLIGAVGGISFDLGRNVELRGRYTIDITPNNESGNTYVPSYRNQVWQVGLGFKF
jgi:opacity protein-like surface antigen